MKTRNSTCANKQHLCCTEDGITVRGTLVKSLATRLLAALVVVFLLFGPYYANVLVPWTRYVLIWQVRDSVLLLGSMVLIASAGVGVSEIVRRLNRPFLTRAFNHLFVLALGAGVLANLWFHTTRPQGYRITQFGMETRTLWLALVAAVGYSMARPGSKLVLRCKQLCLIASPTLPIVAFQMFRGPSYPSGIDPLPDPVPASAVAMGGDEAAKPPVYMFLLDAWSYDRTYVNGELRPKFSNLAALSRRSIVFHDAQSPGHPTTISMARLLFETDLPVISDKRGYDFERDGEHVPSTEMKSIFAPAQERGYRTYVLGFTVSYKLLLGDDVEVYRSYPWLAKHHGHNPLAEMGYHAFKAIHYWTDPWSGYLDWKFRQRLDNRWSVWTLQAMKGDALNILGKQPRDTFAFLHYPMPHYPYVHNEDGSYRQFDEKAWDASCLQGYERNLSATDRLIGELVAALKSAGRFDDALLIITSDHAWYADPDRHSGRKASPLTHVPLIIKLPGQEHPGTVSSRFENWHLGRLIELALDTTGGTIDVEGLLEKVRRGVGSGSVGRLARR